MNCDLTNTHGVRVHDFVRPSLPLLTAAANSAKWVRKAAPLEVTLVCLLCSPSKHMHFMAK